VRVIVRAHPKDADLLKSLVWNLRHQAKTAGIRVDFTLVPTETDTWDDLHHIAEGKCTDKALEVRQQERPNRSSADRQSGRAGVHSSVSVDVR
jgi:hypothetical protein